MMREDGNAVEADGSGAGAGVLVLPTLDVVTLTGASRLAGVHRSVVLKAVSSGELRPVGRPGAESSSSGWDRFTLFDRSAVRAWAKSRRPRTSRVSFPLVLTDVELLSLGRLTGSLDDQTAKTARLILAAGEEGSSAYVLAGRFGMSRQRVYQAVEKYLERGLGWFEKRERVLARKSAASPVAEDSPAGMTSEVPMPMSVEDALSSAGMTDADFVAPDSSECESPAE